MNEKRNTFEFFYSEIKKIAEPEINTFIVEGEDYFAVGKELLIEETKLTYYILLTGEDEGMLLLPLCGMPIDNLVDNLDKYSIDGAINAWPMLMGALKRGVDDNYSQPALIKLSFVKEPFWTMARRLENLNLEELDNKYVITKVVELFQYTQEMLAEFQANDVSGWDKVKGYGKAALDGYRKGHAVNAILSVGLSLLGIPTLLGVDGLDEA